MFTFATILALFNLISLQLACFRLFLQTARGLISCFRFGVLIFVLSEAKAKPPHPTILTDISIFTRVVSHPCRDNYHLAGIMRELLCTGGEGAQRWYRGWGDHPQSSSEEGRSAYTHHQAGPHNNNSIPNQTLWEKGRILLQPPSLHFCKYWTLSILGKLLWIATFFAQGIIYEENTKNFAAVL